MNIKLILLFLFLLFIIREVSGQENEENLLQTLENSIKDMEQEEDQPKPIDIKLDGFIIDQTQTKLGHDFYDLFYSNWQPSNNFVDYNIVIEEKPFPQLGTIVIVKINDNEIVQQILQPRYDQIEISAKQSVETAYAYLQNYEAIQKQLSGEDLQGTGIF